MVKLENQEHRPVLTREVAQFLNIKKHGLYIDTTVGAGGHAQIICSSGGKVLGIDWDRQALKIAEQRLIACPDVVLVWENFSKLVEVAAKYGFFPADGILFDLGVSSMQLETKERGFSFQKDSPLDMRMDPEHQGVKAADLLAVLSKKELYALFSQTTQKKLAWTVARAVEGTRRIKPIRTTGELVKTVEKVAVRRRIHPATTIFLALRMAVNSELENLEKALPQAQKVLATGGRLVVISFHSGEDRIVKNFLKDREDKGTLKILTKKPIKPTDDEIRENPRSRSAKLRAAEKL